jgi:hypothetical protein
MHDEIYRHAIIDNNPVVSYGSHNAYDSNKIDSALSDVFDVPFNAQEITEKPLSKASAYIKKQKEKVPFFNTKRRDRS